MIRGLFYVVTFATQITAVATAIAGSEGDHRCCTAKSSLIAETEPHPGKANHCQIVGDLYARLD
jgi:hypothetical protein